MAEIKRKEALKAENEKQMSQKILR